MKIVIFGASASGTSTLAVALAARLEATALDADSFYWESSGRPFESKKEPALRNRQFFDALNCAQNVVVAGSVFSWDEALFRAFDLAVFCYVPKAERMQRLLARERERYGQALDSDAQCSRASAAFVEWAGQYDEPGFPSRSLELHEGWIARLTALGVPVVRLTGCESVAERVDAVVLGLAAAGL